MTPYRDSLAALGAVLSSHARKQAKPASSIALLIVLFLVVPVVAAIALLWSSALSPGVALFALVIVVAPAILARIGIRRTLRNKEDRVELHERGVFQRWEGVDLRFAWEDVTAMRTTRFDVDGEISFRFEVRLRDGRREAIWTDTEHGIALGKLVQADLTTVLARRALEAFEHGEPVVFGDLEARATAGLVQDGRSLPWDRIDRAEIEGGRVRVLAIPGDSPRVFVDLEWNKLDNAAFFVALVNVRGDPEALLKAVDDPLLAAARLALRAMNARGGSR
jgi:hypothetical protein